MKLPCRNNTEVILVFRRTLCGLSRPSRLRNQCSQPCSATVLLIKNQEQRDTPSIWSLQMPSVGSDGRAAQVSN